ncbi:hypothetical protein BSPWISOXPB_7095 [uncultured Gammaproteobacteria bacterium]|nr:hypothetical protein BSPWISOXPB_7095 [uncultured Gammaproteobacteria bacterium]
MIKRTKPTKERLIFQKSLGFDRSNINKLAKQIKFNPKTAMQKSTINMGLNMSKL